MVRVLGRDEDAGPPDVVVTPREELPDSQSCPGGAGQVLDEQHDAV